MRNRMGNATATTVFGPMDGFDERRKTLLKSQGPSGEEAASNQATSAGTQYHPFNMDKVAEYKQLSIYHQTCVNTKIAATVGLGHKNEATDDKLNPLCSISWQDVIESVCDDYFQLGNGYMEVRRNEANEITGLHHVPAPNVWLYLEDARGLDSHFEVYAANGDTQRFARFGDLEKFLSRFKEAQKGHVSELIHFRRSNSFSRWYGFPDWLAAFMTMDIAKAMREHQMSFFKNRGVPEVITWSKGAISDEALKKIQEAQQKHVGAANAHKNMHLHFEDEDVHFEVIKLNTEAKTESMFLNLSEVTSRDIVSAHRVPPLLAGITIPQRLGAANEVVNALMSFQILVCGPEQKRLRTMLGCTLGNSKHSNLGLSEKDFEWDKITDEFNMADLDTISRMREPLPEAIASGRDIKEGLRD